MREKLAGSRASAEEQSQELSSDSAPHLSKHRRVTGIFITSASLVCCAHHMDAELQDLAWQGGNLSPAPAAGLRQRRTVNTQPPAQHGAVC